MPQVFDPPPSFAAGQVLSAGGHLNALARSVQTLHDDLVGCQLPFNGYTVNRADAVVPTRSWAGYIRHKQNTLAYNIVVTSGTVTLTYNGVTLATLTAGSYDTTADLTPLGLSVDTFYPVVVSGGSSPVFTVNHIYETYTPTYPALIDFDEEVTPTAAQWQALSDTATALAGVLSHPYAPMKVWPMWGHEEGNNKTWNVYYGTFWHQCQYLAYEAYGVIPGNADNGQRWSRMQIYANGVEILRLAWTWTGTGYGTAAAPAATVTMHGTGTLSGLIDLTPFSLTAGAPVTIRAVHSDSHTYEWYPTSQLKKLHEVSAAVPTLAGWTALPTWAHGDYVHGGATGVDAIRANLALLKTLAAYVNPAARDWAMSAATETAYAGKRRWRWLHYRNDAGAAPKIAYTVGTEEKSVGLPDASAQWLAYDMEQAANLYPGTEYRLSGVSCALEDVVP